MLGGFDKVFQEFNSKCHSLTIWTKLVALIEIGATEKKAI